MTAPLRRVLLVEDSPVLRRLFALWCEHAGCAVTTAPGLRAAEALLDELAPEAMPELLVADFELGDGAAFHLFERVGAPVIVCSGHERRALPDGHDARVAAWLRKPVSRAEFVAALDAALGRSEPSVSPRDLALRAAYEAERSKEFTELVRELTDGLLDDARRRAHRFAGVAAVFRDEPMADVARRVEQAALAGEARVALDTLRACPDFNAASPKAQP
ncbi:Hpt domain-containing response regulator [Derxia gummosa]|uniref:Hpt domain-containing response regulator n=1 Tax=Derxia gummosa DSM 723 TaxID=1121388 RepID=A0A8B6X178_9BURK|nr:response regulator [Derxia gummosa]